MKRVKATHPNGETDLADRLALTAQDRRLESRVLLEMIRGADRVQPTPPAAQDVGAGDSRISEGRTFAHAARIASFLLAEYGLEKLEEKSLVSELAVELAQRIAEEIGGDREPGPG